MGLDVVLAFIFFGVDSGKENDIRAFAERMGCQYDIRLFES